LTMQYGLIGAGPVSQYLVRWFPHLPTELGPVAANNPRLASRIVNTLRAGSALRDVSGLQDVPVILICAPGHHLESLLPFLKDAALDWRGKKIVLCNCDLFSRQMEFIRECGAHVASLRPIAGMPKRLLIEGDREAVKAARYFVTEMRAVAVEIEPDSTGSGNFGVAARSSRRVSVPAGAALVSLFREKELDGHRRGREQRMDEARIGLPGRASAGPCGTLPRNCGGQRAAV
jgi:hypothetical protein